MMIERRFYTHTRRFLSAACAAMMAAAVFLGGCAKEDEKPRRRDKDDTARTDTTAGTTADPTLHTSFNLSEIKGVVNGYEYTLTKPEEYGPDLDYGWYIRDTEDEKYVSICHGMEYTGGYFIEVTGIEYDETTDTVVIRVMHTRDPNIVTDAYTHPCCYVKFKKLPGNIKVYAEDDSEVMFGGKIIKTQEWAVDIPVDDDYTVIFTGGWSGRVCFTYVYPNADGGYRYINVVRHEADSDELFVKGSGTVMDLGYIEWVCQKFGSWQYAMVKGDEDNLIPVDEYMKTH